jgi:hypothetical protein
MNVKSPNNISKWHMRFNSAFKGLMEVLSMDAIARNWVCQLFPLNINVLFHIQMTVRFLTQTTKSRVESKLV